MAARQLIRFRQRLAPRLKNHDHVKIHPRSCCEPEQSLISRLNGANVKRGRNMLNGFDVYFIVAERARSKGSPHLQISHAE